MYNITTFKERLKQTCKETGISQKYLTDKIGRKNTYLNDIWNGKCALKPEDLNSFADTLGVSPDYLIGETDNPTPDSTPVQLSPEEVEVLELYRDILPEKQELFRNIIEQLSGWRHAQDFSFAKSLYHSFPDLSSVFAKFTP